MPASPPARRYASSAKPGVSRNRCSRPRPARTTPAGRVNTCSRTARSAATATVRSSAGAGQRFASSRRGTGCRELGGSQGSASGGSSGSAQAPYPTTNVAAANAMRPGGPIGNHSSTARVADASDTTATRRRDGGGRAGRGGSSAASTGGLSVRSRTAVVPPARHRSLTERTWRAQRSSRLSVGESRRWISAVTSARACRPPAVAWSPVGARCTCQPVTTAMSSAASRVSPSWYAAGAGATPVMTTSACTAAVTSTVRTVCGSTARSTCRATSRM